jgi:hypothetical protein
MRNDFDPNNRVPGPDFDGDRMPEADDAVWNLLSTFADGEATPDEVRKVEELLRSDPAYQRDLALIRHASQVARTMNEVEPPARLRQAILASTTQRPTPARRAAALWQRVSRVFTPAPARLALAGTALAAAALAALTVLPARHPAGLAYKPGPVPHGLAQQTRPVNPERATPASQPRRHIGPESTPMSETPRIALARPAATHRKVDPAMIALAGLTHTPHNLPGGGHPADRMEHPRSRAIAYGPASLHSQRPSTMSRPTAELADYTVSPLMDQRFQRQLVAAATGPAARREAGVPGPDVVAADSNAEAAATPVASPAMSPAIPKADTPSDTRTGVRIAHVSQLPPTTFVVPTTELRRQMEARNLNLNTATMEGLQRREATFTLISTHF